MAGSVRLTCKTRIPATPHAVSGFPMRFREPSPSYTPTRYTFTDYAPTHPHINPCDPDPEPVATVADDKPATQPAAKATLAYHPGRFRSPTSTPPPATKVISYVYGLIPICQFSKFSVDLAKFINSQKFLRTKPNYPKIAHCVCGLSNISLCLLSVYDDSFT